MADPVFVRTRHVYDSYRDLISLIELSGFPLVYVDELDPTSDNTYILTVLNGETTNGWPSARARIVLLDLEWRLDGAYPQVPGVREIVACDRWYAGQIGARYTPLGSHAGLNLEPGRAPHDYQYDVAMLAYMVWRRQVIQGKLIDEQGLTVAPNGLNPIRHEILSHSALMVHVHQHDNVQTVAPLRFALAAAYKLPLIAEEVTDCGVQNGPIHYASYGDLATTARKVRDDAAWREDAGAALWQKWCIENDFRKTVENML